MKPSFSRVGRHLRWVLWGYGRTRWSLVRLGILGTLVALAGVSCAEGTYPLDFFYEMHYQVSFRSQEPPRLMPAAQSVPITGKEVKLTSLEMAEELTNPIPNQEIERGAELFNINCTMCHGAGARGDGPTLEIMTNKDPEVGIPYGYDPILPPDLVLGLISRSDGWIFAMISNRDLILTDPNLDKVMPQFEKLLTAEERWMLVNYIRSLPGP